MAQKKTQTQVRIHNRHVDILTWLKEQYGVASNQDAIGLIVTYAATPEGHQALEQFVKAMKPKPESIYPLAEFPAGR